MKTETEKYLILLASGAVLFREMTPAAALAFKDYEGDEALSAVPLWAFEDSPAWVKPPRVRLVARVHGGVLQDVMSNKAAPVEFILIDDDHLEQANFSPGQIADKWEEETKGMTAIF